MAFVKKSVGKKVPAKGRPPFKRGSKGKAKPPMKGGRPPFKGGQSY